MGPELHVVGSSLSLCVILSARAEAPCSGFYSMITLVHVCMCVHKGLHVHL